MKNGNEYLDFLEKKKCKINNSGFKKTKLEMNPNLFEWQKDIVIWALKKGRAAIFEDCGLGKTIQQLEWAQSVVEKTKKPVIIISPLAVAAQTKREGKKFGYDVHVCRSMEDVKSGINTTNYEILERFDTSIFSGVVLDESSILKNFSGKMKNQIIQFFAQTPYRLSCTATPSPNDYEELGNQAEFLGVMKRTEMLATYFTHDGANTSKWRLKKHAEDQFWDWVSEWAVAIKNPSDLGYPSERYALPELNIKEYLVRAEKNCPGLEMTLFGEEAKTLSQRRDARRNSINNRCKKAADIVSKDKEGQWLIWCDLNDESSLLSKLIPEAIEIKGSDRLKEKEKNLNRFTEGDIKILITKPSIAGFGLNWQACHNMIFVGLSDSYEMMYQAIRRCYRFGQLYPVNIYIITSMAEGAVRENIIRKEYQNTEFYTKMAARVKRIIEEEIRGTVRISISYDPKEEMTLPEWVKIC